MLIIEDKYQLKPPRPFAPGGEIAGEVEAVGEGVEGWSVGDRVIAVTGFGGLAEKVVIPAQVRVPPAGRAQLRGRRGAAADLCDLDPRACSTAGGCRRGRRLLVLGAAGGVGLAAVELGKAYGARVIAAVSSEEKAQAAREAGADEAIVYPPGPFDRDGQKALAQLFKDAVGPAGADVIFDPVGGDYTEAALRSIAWEGRFLVVGFPAGIPRLPLNLTLLKSCDVCGVFWGAFAARDPKANAAHVDTLFQLWRRGQDRAEDQRAPIRSSAPARRSRDRRAPGGRQAGGDAGLIPAAPLSAAQTSKGSQ